MSVATTLLESQARSKDQDVAHLVIVITDGAENQSRVDRAELRARIQRLTGSDRWTFAFQGPRYSSGRIQTDLGFLPGNVTEWEQTATGMNVAAAQNSVGTQAFYGARSRGLNSVQSFYQTDASQIKKRDLKALTDLSKNFKVCTADKTGEQMDALVKRKTRKELVLGAAYYKLIRKETVQGYKSVVLRHRTTGKIYGGLEARELIGLPAAVAGVGNNASVVPGNHGEFDIFVQSTAPNRKPAVGTEVLVDLTHLIPSRATWTATPKAGSVVTP